MAASPGAAAHGTLRDISSPGTDLCNPPAAMQGGWVAAVNCREIQAWCKEQYREIQSTTALCSETQLSAVNIQKNAFSGPESACIIIIVLFDKSVLATVFFCIEIMLALALLRSFATKT